MLDPGVIAMAVPIIALMIPIVAILTRHQRSMAELIHSKSAVAPNELDAIRQEIRELRTILHSQTIALDDIRSRSMAQPADPSIQNRLEVS
jgi:hypothetical protein